jgi:hypothetical protein
MIQYISVCLTNLNDMFVLFKEPQRNFLPMDMSAGILVKPVHIHSP